MQPFQTNLFALQLVVNNALQWRLCSPRRRQIYVELVDILEMRHPRGKVPQTIRERIITTVFSLESKSQ